MLKWWWLWQDVSLTHLPTPPMSVHSSPSRTLPWAVLHSHHDFWSVGSPSRTGFSHGWSVHPHAEVDGLFIPPDGLLIRVHRGGRFPSRAGWYLHAEVGYVFLVYFAVGASFSSRTDWLGCSIHVRAVLTVLFGAVVSPRFVGCGFNPRIGLLLISPTFWWLGSSNSFWVTVDSQCVGWVSLFWDCA